MPEDAGRSRSAEAGLPWPRAAKDWITVDEAVLLFRELGLPRSPEAIRGYCRDGKLEATTTQGIKGEQHVIERRSAEIYIEDRKQVLAAMSRDMPEPAGTFRKVPVTSVTSRQMPEDAGTFRQPEGTGAAEASAAGAEALKARDAEIARLRDENMSLKIDKAARDQIVAMLRDERAQLAGEAMEKSRRVGELEASLALQLPGAHRPAPIQRAGDRGGDAWEAPRYEGREEGRGGDDHEAGEHRGGDSRFDAGHRDGV